MQQRFPKNFQIAVLLFCFVFAMAAFSLVKLKVKNKDVTSGSTEINSWFFDLESNSILENGSTTKSGLAHSGTHSCKMDENTEYSSTFIFNQENLSNRSSFREVVYSFYIFAESPVDGVEAVYSFETVNNKKSDWQNQAFNISSGEWKKYEIIFPLNNDFRLYDGVMKLYVWNKNKQNFLIDDIAINLR